MNEPTNWTFESPMSIPDSSKKKASKLFVYAQKNKKYKQKFGVIPRCIACVFGTSFILGRRKRRRALQKKRKKKETPLVPKVNS